MKRYGIYFICIVSIYACIRSNKIKIENQAVVQSAYPYSIEWIPTVKDTNIAIESVWEFLKSPKAVTEWDRSEIKKIKQNFSKYKVQFAGIEVHGQKKILCNFFWSERNIDDVIFGNWRNELITIKDGGFWYWQIEYDTSSGECMNFQSNGYS